MSKADIVILIRIALSVFVVFGFPHFLKIIFSQNKRKKHCIYIITLIMYFICIVLFAFVFRTEVNGTGIITDPLWAYRQLFRNIVSGYKAGGIVEGIRRIRWVRDTVASLILNIMFFVPFGYLVPSLFKWPRLWWRVLILSFLFSVSIEIVQYITHRGWFDIADLIYNSGGALIGYNSYRRLLYER